MTSSSLSLARVALAALLTVSISACDDTVAPKQSATVSSSIAVVGSDSAPAGATDTPRIEVEGSTLVVRGVIETPNPCQRLSAAVTQRAGRVEVTITARPQGEVCITVLGQFAYRVAEQLPRGQYIVALRHQYPGTGWPTVLVTEQTISIP
jgi:hypothetical protein